MLGHRTISLLLTTLLIIGLFISCGPGGVKKEDEEAYRTFIKEREKTRLGFDVNLLEKALQNYLEYRNCVYEGQLDAMKFRELTAQKDMNTIEYMPVFAVIKEIEDSLKTKSGVVYANEKYTRKVVDMVKNALKVKSI